MNGDRSKPLLEITRVDEPRQHPWLWVFAFLCLVISVPFYYPEGRVPVLIYGLPDWCWVTLVADTVFAIIVAYLILRTWTDLPEEE